MKRHNVGKVARKHLESRAWARTHRDYRAILDGKKAVLIQRNGGTTLCPVADLTDAELAKLA